MKQKYFKDLIDSLDGCNRYQLQKIIHECVRYLVEMLPYKKKGGF